MKLTSLIFIISLCTLNAAFSQDSEFEQILFKADSLDNIAEYEDASDLYLGLLKLATTHNNYKTIAHCKIRLSNIYIIKSEYQKAKEILTNALEEDAESNLKHPKELSKIYHHLGIVNMKLGQLDEALSLHQKSLNLKMGNNFSTIEMAKSHLQIGHTYLYKNNEKPALFHLEKALEFAKSSSLKHKIFAKIYRHLGNYQYGLMNYPKSLEYNMKALDVIKDMCSLKDPLRQISLLNIGEIHLKLGNYKKARSYMLRSRDIASLNKYQLSLALTDNHLGQLYKKTNELKLAETHFLSAIKILKTVFKENDHVRIANSYQYLGDLYVEMKKLDDANLYYNKALKIREESKKKGNGNYLFLIEIYIGLGKINEKKENWSGAKDNYFAAYNMALDKSKTITQSPIFIIPIYNSIARIYLKTEQYNEAIIELNKAIKVNNAADEKAIDRILLLESNQLKLSCLLEKYNLTKNETDLVEAESTIEKSNLLIDNIRISYKDEADQVNFNKIAHSFYELAIEFSYILSKNKNALIHKQNAFEFMGKNKSHSLLQNLQGKEALQYADISIEKLNLEKQLRIQVSRLEFESNLAYLQNDEKKRVEIQNQLFDKENEYQKLIDYLEINHPNYYKIKYKTQIQSLHLVQKWIPEKTVLIEYFYGAKSVYVIVIQKKRIEFIKLKNSTDLTLELETFYENFRPTKSQAETETSVEVKNYAKSSYNVYESTIKEAIESFVDKVENIIIIPDGPLNFNSFELLIYKQTNGISTFKNLPYLLNKYAISYSSSTSLLIDNNNQNSEKQSLYIGFAPNYSKDVNLKNGVVQDSKGLNQLNDLPYSRNEINSIANMLDGDMFINEKAKKSTFTEKASNFKILHLAMHGVVDNENPLFSKLLFTPGTSDSSNILYAYEIYNMNLNADLTILSSCNSGTGNYHKGEGVMSLSRAFTYAGCPSVLMSLWEVSDNYTSTIITSYFKNMKLGIDKSKSLQKAKIEYLESCPPSASHPMLWGACIITGDINTISLKNRGSNLILFSLIAIALLLYFISRRIFSAFL